MRKYNKKLIINNLDYMARKLDSLWHAFNTKNDENTEVAKVPIFNVTDTFLKKRK